MGPEANGFNAGIFNLNLCRELRPSLDINGSYLADDDDDDDDDDIFWVKSDCHRKKRKGEKDKRSVFSHPLASFNFCTGTGEAVEGGS